mgnify:CR=1 FL=1
MRKHGNNKEWQPEQAAANGILNRRVFLEGALVAAAAGAGVDRGAGRAAARAELDEAAGRGVFRLRPAVAVREQGGAEYRAASQPATQGIGTARTPLQLLNGTITPNGLHFERSHSGMPDIDPDQHRLLIHGLVKRPLVFTLEALSRYPMESRIAFIECAGNCGALNARAGAAAQCRRPFTACSCCAEWTGVRLSTLLDEAGVEPSAQMGGGRGRRCRRDEPQRPARQVRWMTRSSASTRTASGCGPRTAIRCGCCCPASKAT